MGDRNVLGGELEPCGTDPVTGFYRDGCCSTGPEDLGSHTICAVVTAEFLDHQRRIGNDLSSPAPQFGFPGLVPGDRWCVTAANWLRAHHDGVGAPIREPIRSAHQPSHHAALQCAGRDAHLGIDVLAVINEAAAPQKSEDRSQRTENRWVGLGDHHVATFAQRRVTCQRDIDEEIEISQQPALLRNIRREGAHHFYGAMLIPFD